jgi:hypothetical protein
MKCTVQEAKSPAKISSGSVVQRDLILALKGYACTSSVKLLKPQISQNSE